ncbi:MAG: tetratricopeptide repeat protein [Candidatus Omnitrophica bacterium]|nr:tetratricopeptide repeat protein [Candidatus Omnitrophota bacterium]
MSSQILLEKKMRKIVYILLLLILPSYLAYPETIKLKSGQVVEGEIVERNNESIKIDIEGLPLTYYLDDIESIDGKHIVVQSFISSSEEHIVSSIKKYVDELGYDVEVSDKIIDMARSLNLIKKYDKLKHLRKALEGESNKKYLVDLEIEIAQSIQDKLLSLFDYDIGVYDLREVFDTRRINCVGFTQLGWIFMRALKLEFILAQLIGEGIKEWDENSLGPHSFGLIKLNDRNYYWFDIRKGDFVQLGGRSFGIGEHYFLKSKKEGLLLRVLNGDRNAILAEKFNAQGLVAFANGDYSKALILYSQAKKYDPGNPLYCLNRAKVFSEQGNIADAYEDLDEAISIEPRYSEPYSFKAQVNYEDNDFEQSVQNATKAIKLGSFQIKFVALIDRALAYSHLKDYNKAKDDIYKALEINPSSDLAKEVLAILDKAEKRR